MSVKGSLYAYFDFAETLAPFTTEAVVRALRAGVNPLTFSDGSGDSAVTKIWTYRESLASTSRTWDLTALPVSNLSGTGTGSPLQSFSKIKVLLLYNEGTDGQIVYLGNAASNPWYAFTDTAAARVKAMPGIPLILGYSLTQTTNPWTVDATNKNLKIETSATITYSLLLAGT